ncbi:mechanosensitive ion channel [Candidatus Thorarchaeota archaeon]|nr:MAG: mechanosensitive ion channel [Candidatus Thorarchaeota archaeon]
MQDIFSYFVEYLKILLTPFGLEEYAGLIAALPFFVFLYILYLITIRFVKVSFKKVGMPREATSGTVFGIRLFYFSVALLVILSLAGETIGAYVLAGGALLGTAIGLAFSRALQNIVSGVYILVARPFRVGDYIRMGDSEGMVLEITLNYTRILRPDHTRQFIPNSMSVDSKMTNFRVRIDDYFDERGLEYRLGLFDHEDDNDSRFDNAIDKLRYLTKGDEVFRYTFDIELERTCSRPVVQKYFESVCRKWDETFALPPEFIFWNSTATTITYRFAIITQDSKDIITKGQDFRTELAEYPTK